MLSSKNDHSVEENSDLLELSDSISPSDISNHSFYGNFKRSSSLPIQSNLPTLFNNLRANDRKESSNSGTSPGRSWLRKLMSPSNKLNDLGSMENTKPGWTVKNASSKSLGDNTNNEEDLYDISLDNERETSAYPFKDIDQVKIPPVFFKEGLSLLKVSHKSKKRTFFQIGEKDFQFSLKNAYASASTTASSGLYRLLTPTSTYQPKNKFYEFSIDDIKAISYQKDASNYRKELHVSKEFENQWLTIIYFDKKKKKWKTIHVIADTERDLKKLLSVLSGLKKLRNNLAKNYLLDLNDIDETQRNMFIGRSQEENEKQIRKFLSFNDILKYSKRLNINMNPTYLRTIFNFVCTDSSVDRGLDFDQFKQFVSILKTRHDITHIWNSTCGENKSMTYDIFKKFMSDVQKESFTEEYLRKIFRKFCIEDKNYWIPENFNNFLLSKYSTSMYNAATNESYFDHPLNEYFISSSHNTYLMGRQVAGDSSIEGYIKALQRGCRCVEVDIWDGYIDGMDDNDKTNNEPIVSHGRTFTSSISLNNVFKTIKKYAFITSPFPLIISLEINCSIDNQLKVVRTLKEVLGDTLITQPIDDKFTLPTPLQLKHKILLKVKKTSPFSDLIASENGNYVSSTTTTTTSFSEDNGSGGVKRRSSFSIRRRKARKITDTLSDLGIYLQGLKFRNFSLPESKTFNHCFSLSEKSINTMLKDDIKCASIDKHNRKYFMRVYPSNIRLKSSNFLPMNYWSHGVQMVATNWQTYDLGQQINESLFESTNRRGYVLKPDALRKPLLKSSNRSIVAKRTIKTKFDIEIISAHQLPKPKGSVSAINPFINFDITGASDIVWDRGSTPLRTSIIPENGFNPIWNEKFSGTITTSDDFVFVRFLINASSSISEVEEIQPIGILVCKLFDLKKGYRYLPINDLLGEELIYSTLFVKINYYEL